MSSTEPRLLTGYVPSLALTGAACAAFTICALIFSYLFWRSRSHKWMLSLTLGTIFMAVGFYIRIPMTNQPGSLMIYILTTLFTLLAPCAFLAHNYLLLPRLAAWLGADDCLFLKPRLIARTFVWIDVTVFLVQAAGGGMTAISSLADVGSKIATVGLVIQCISFGVFTALALVFWYKLRRNHPQKWTAGSQGSGFSWKTDWRVMYFAVLFNCVFILIRCVFRVAEFAEGYSGKLRTTEWYIYVFDTLPLLLAIAIWVVVWPPRYFDQGAAGWTSTTPTGSDSSHAGMNAESVSMGAVQHEGNGGYTGGDTPASKSFLQEQERAGAQAAWGRGSRA